VNFLDVGPLKYNRRKSGQESSRREDPNAIRFVYTESINGRFQNSPSLHVSISSRAGFLPQTVLSIHSTAYTANNFISAF